MRGCLLVAASLAAALTVSPPAGATADVEPSLDAALQRLYNFDFEDAHARLASAAAAAGFEVVDLLPVFRTELGDGVAHRNDPADNHFDAATHALVAQLLQERI